MPTWEQRKFSNIAMRRTSFSDDDKLPQVEYEDIVSGEGRLNKNLKLKGIRKSGIRFDSGDILYGKLRPYLNNWLLPAFSGVAVGDWWVLQALEVDSSFLYRLVQSASFQKVANVSTGSKMPRADWQLVGETGFALPQNTEEQRHIGTTFSRIDALITLHQREPWLTDMG